MRSAANMGRLQNDEARVLNSHCVLSPDRTKAAIRWADSEDIKAKGMARLRATCRVEIVADEIYVSS